MSGHRHQSSSQSTGTAQELSPQVEAGPQDLVGNGALVEQSGVTGPTSVYAALRQKVGDTLAEAILDNLSEDDLMEHVSPLIDDLIARMQSEAAQQTDHGLNEEQLGTVFADLDAKLEEAARHFLTQLNADERLAGLVRDNPELAAVAAIAGVLAYALTQNPDLPELSKDRDQGGGHSVGGSIDLGPVLDLTVQHLEARWSFDGEQTDANARIWGGENDGGIGAEGDLTHTLDSGGILGAQARYFRQDGGDQEASGRLSFDGARTDGHLEGEWARRGGQDTWGLGAALTHDGEDTDYAFDGRFDRTPTGDSWSLGGSRVHDGPETDSRLEARLAQDASGDRTGHVAGAWSHEADGWRREVDGRANLDGTWNAHAGLDRTADDHAWSLDATAARDESGTTLGTLSGDWRGTHDGFTSTASGRYATDGTWNAQGALTGTDTDSPWSLRAEAGRTALDPEVDWSLTGEFGTALDESGNTRLSGIQTIARDQASSRLQLDHSLGGAHSASAWLEHQRGVEGDVTGIGGELTTQFQGADAYARGFYRTDNTWEAAAGISKGTANDDLSWFAEGYTNRNELGESDTGARAGLRWRF